MLPYFLKYFLKYTTCAETQELRPNRDRTWKLGKRRENGLQLYGSVTNISATSSHGQRTCWNFTRLRNWFYCFQHFHVHPIISSSVTSHSVIFTFISDIGIVRKREETISQVNYVV